MKITYVHYRVDADHEQLPKKGPSTGYLERYTRSEPVFVPHSRGGATLCHIDLPDGRSATGRSECSFSDNFSYKLGAQIAKGRAMTELGL